MWFPRWLSQSAPVCLWLSDATLSVHTSFKTLHKSPRFIRTDSTPSSFISEPTGQTLDLSLVTIVLRDGGTSALRVRWLIAGQDAGPGAQLQISRPAGGVWELAGRQFHR